MIRLKAGGQIASLEVKECKNMRAAKKTGMGAIETWYWSGGWPTEVKGGTSQEDKKIVAIPSYNGEEKRQPKFVIINGDYLFNDGYYPIPDWWGGWEWIQLANCIPQFHQANLQNGYNIRWHIQIPEDYFLNYEELNSCVTAEEKNACYAAANSAEQVFLDSANNFLAGLNNSGRALFTKYELDKALGREYPGIKITALDYDMKDSALLDLFEKSNTANISSQGLHPTLANIETQGKLSSGTEMRNAYLMWLIINTPKPRNMMLAPIRLIKKINNWPSEIHYKIRDYEMTALSEDKAGMQEKKPNESK
jgi:hypothetical protein